MAMGAASRVSFAGGSKLVLKHLLQFWTKSRALGSSGRWIEPPRGLCPGCSGCVGARTGLVPSGDGGTVPWPVRPHTVLELLLRARLAQDSQLGWSIPGHTSEGGSPTRNVPATFPPGFPDGCFWLGCPWLWLQVRDAPGRRLLPSLLPSADLHLRAQHMMLSWHCSRPTAGRGRRGSNEQLVGSLVLVRGRT